MAHTTTHAPVAPFSGFGRALNSFFSLMVRLGENSAKARQINALMELSDGELEARGLKREDIARYVFQNCYWV